MGDPNEAKLELDLDNLAKAISESEKDEMEVLRDLLAEE